MLDEIIFWLQMIGMGLLLFIGIVLFAGFFLTIVLGVPAILVWGMIEVAKIISAAL